MNLEILNVKINTLKENLYILMCSRNLTDDSVVKCSKELDELIVEYQNEKGLIKKQ